jgi:hypothetical protein
MPQPQPRKHTPGYKAREQEERERSGSTPFDMSSPTATGQGGIIAQRTPSPQAIRAPQRQAPPPQPQPQPHPPALSFPGAMPSVDWGSISLPTDTLSLQQPVPTSEAYNFNEYVPTPSAVGMAAANPLLSVEQHQGSDASSPGTVPHEGYHAGPTDTSPMDVMNEIDWVSKLHTRIGTELTQRRARLRRCLVARKLGLV